MSVEESRRRRLDAYCAPVLRSQPPTPRQMDSIRAHIATGTMKGAGYLLGISRHTVQAHIREARLRVGVETTEQLILVLALRGYLSQEGIPHPRRRADD